MNNLDLKKSKTSFNEWWNDREDENGDLDLKKYFTKIFIASFAGIFVFIFITNGGFEHITEVILYSAFAAVSLTGILSIVKYSSMEKSPTVGRNRISGTDYIAHSEVDALVSERENEFKAENPDIKNLVYFGNVPIDPRAECLHTLITASTGAGKSVALRQMIKDIKARGDRIFCIDAGYDMQQNGLYEKDDLILSLFDENAQGWDLRNEIKQPHEWSTFIGSAIPAAAGEAGEWDKKAQAFVSAIAKARPLSTNKELLLISTTESTQGLQILLEGSPAAALLADGGERYLSSIRSGISEKLASWEYSKSGDFSIRDWLLSDDPRSLWVPYKDSEIGQVQNTITAWGDILIKAGLERANQPNARRTWIVIDELDSLGKLDALQTAVARLRKSNIAVVAAIQDVAQLNINYGKETAKAMLTNFSNRLYLRAASAELADFIVDDLGDTEWEGISLNAEGKASLSREVSPALLNSHFQSLADLKGYAKFARDERVWPIQLTF